VHSQYNRGDTEPFYLIISIIFKSKENLDNNIRKNPIKTPLKNEHAVRIYTSEDLNPHIKDVLGFNSLLASDP